MSLLAKTCVVLVASTIFALTARAQSPDDLAPISRAELLGYWQEFSFPPEVARHFRIRTTIPYDCQYLHIRDDGVINKISITFNSSQRACPKDDDIRSGFD